MREVVDARVEVRRQQLSQLQAHLEPDQAILHRQRLGPRQEPEAQQGDGEDDAVHRGEPGESG